MLPHFFDSVLDLIIKTSTDLPPDVRAAMKAAMGQEEAGTRSAQALTIIAQNIDQAADGEGAICQDTGMPTFEIKTPVGANQIWMKQQIRRRSPRPPRAASSAPTRSIRSPARTPATTSGPGTPVIHFEQWEQDDDRGEAAPQGRRLREHEHPVLGAVRAAAPGPRRPRPRGRAQVHPARRVAGAGQGLRPRRHRRRASAATAPAATCDAKQQLFRTLDDVNPDRAAGRARSRRSWGRSTRSASGRWGSAARRR